MTQIAAIAYSLLKGDVLTIMDGFKKFACSNLPRELSRGIEKKFDLFISRDKVTFVSQYGQSGYYYRYRLNRSPRNKAGIELLQQYVKEQLGAREAPKTSQQAKEFKQQELFLGSL